MRILYYIPDLSQTNGGVRQYAYALLKMLAQNTNNQYYVLANVDDKDIQEIVREFQNLNLIPYGIGEERKIERLMRYIVKLSMLFPENYNSIRKSNLFSRTERICDIYKIDVVYCPYQYIGNTTRKTVSTLHDVQELHFPEFFSAEDRLQRALLHKSITDKSSLIVVSYEHIKQDVITYFQRTNNNVLVCLLDMKNLWFDSYNSKDIIDIKLCKPLNQFILYPAAMWPHKNHLGLLRAIARLRDIYSQEIHIVFTGHEHTHFIKIKELTNQLSLSRQVHFLGVVDEKILYSLYQTARAVVIPTLYEAGSFPLMESLMMGVPVISSNVTSLPIAMGDNRFLFDPNDEIGMAELIKNICFDEQFRQENLENGRIQSNKLRDSGAFDKLSNALHNIHSTP